MLESITSYSSLIRKSLPIVSRHHLFQTCDTLWQEILGMLWLTFVTSQTTSKCMTFWWLTATVIRVLLLKSKVFKHMNFPLGLIKCNFQFFNLQFSIFFKFSYNWIREKGHIDYKTIAFKQYMLCQYDYNQYSYDSKVLFLEINVMRFME